MIAPLFVDRVSQLEQLVAEKVQVADVGEERLSSRVAQQRVIDGIVEIAGTIQRSDLPHELADEERNRAVLEAQASALQHLGQIEQLQMMTGSHTRESFVLTHTQTRRTLEQLADRVILGVQRVAHRPLERMVECAHAESACRLEVAAAHVPLRVTPAQHLSRLITTTKIYT